MYKIGDKVAIAGLILKKGWVNADLSSIGQEGVISCISTNHISKYYGVTFYNKDGILNREPRYGMYDWAYLPEELGYQMTFSFNPEPKTMK